MWTLNSTGAGAGGRHFKAEQGWKWKGGVSGLSLVVFEVKTNLALNPGSIAYWWCDLGQGTLRSEPVFSFVKYEGKPFLPPIGWCENCIKRYLETVQHHQCVVPSITKSKKCPWHLSIKSETLWCSSASGYFLALWCFFQKADLEQKSSWHVKKSGDSQWEKHWNHQVSKSISLGRTSSNLGIAKKNTLNLKVALLFHNGENIHFFRDSRLESTIRPYSNPHKPFN